LVVDFSNRSLIIRRSAVFPSAVVRLQRFEKEDKMILQAVVVVIFFVAIPLWACCVASKGDYPGRDALQRALAGKEGMRGG